MNFLVEMNPVGRHKPNSETTFLVTLAIAGNKWRFSERYCAEKPALLFEVVQLLCRKVDPAKSIIGVIFVAARFGKKNYSVDRASGCLRETYYLKT